MSIGGKCEKPGEIRKRDDKWLGESFLNFLESLVGPSSPSKWVVNLVEFVTGPVYVCVCVDPANRCLGVLLVAVDSQS